MDGSYCQIFTIMLNFCHKTSDSGKLSMMLASSTIPKREGKDPKTQEETEMRKGKGRKWKHGRKEREMQLKTLNQQKNLKQWDSHILSKTLLTRTSILASKSDELILV
jgi:hypothetical protein